MKMETESENPRFDFWFLFYLVNYNAFYSFVFNNFLAMVLFAVLVT